MLYFFSGTDTAAARKAMNDAVAKAGKNMTVVRITDAHTPADLEAALLGGGMFAEKRVVVLDTIFSNDALRDIFEREKDRIRKSEEDFFMLEGALDAATRKGIEKYAEEFKKFDAEKVAKRETIFALANALQSGKKKDLWVGYQRELADGKAPEAIHGVLFWAAKQQLLRKDDERSRALVAELAELPHEARRQGFDLEYALEHFVLSRT